MVPQDQLNLAEECKLQLEEAELKSILNGTNSFCCTRLRTVEKAANFRIQGALETGNRTGRRFDTPNNSWL
jgi:hypothetical protein